MSAVRQRVAWSVIGFASAMAAGTVVKRGLDAGWRAATEDEPPDKPESLRIGWKDALLWTAVSAVVVGVAELTARRGAALGWRQITGKRPPG
jgi:hypothetical protein